MNSDAENIVNQPYNLVHPGHEHNFSELKERLETLDATKVIFWCAKLALLRHMDPHPSSDWFERLFAKYFFTKHEIALMERTLAKLDKPPKNLLSCFNERVLLELIRWTALLCPNQSNPISKTSFEDRKAILLAAINANFLYYSRTVIEHSTPYLDSVEDHRFEFNLPMFRDHYLLTPGQRWNDQLLGRSSILLRDRFFSQAPNLSEEFKQASGLSLDDYLSSVLFLLSFVLRERPSSHTKLEKFGIITMEALGLKSTTARGKVEQFLSFESQSIDQLSRALLARLGTSEVEETTPFDTRAIRSRPFVHDRHGTFMLIDVNLLLDKLWVGPVFHLLQSSSNAKALFGSLGNAIEGYVFDLLQSIVDSDREKYERIELGPKGRTERGVIEITDVCLKHSHRLLMLEVKSAWLPEEMLWFHNDAAYLRGIQARYAGDVRLRKGVGQLARSIVGLASGGIAADDPALFQSARTIYPVVIGLDEEMSVPMLQQFLANCFEEAVAPALTQEWKKKEKFGRIGDYLVARPRVITLTDLEMQECTRNQWSLIDFIERMTDIDPDATLPTSWMARVPRMMDVLPFRYDTLIGGASLRLASLLNKFTS